MKKFFLTSAILSLSMLFTHPLTAQIKVLSNGDVKIADNPSSTSVRGVEIIKPNLTFTGSSVKFNFSGKTLEIKSNGNSSVFPSSSENISNGIGDPILPYTGNITILGPKNGVELGSTTQLLKDVYATTIHYFYLDNLSDRRYKTNIMDLSPVSEKIMRLRPVRFDYLEEKEGELSTDPRKLNRVGLIAQELLDVIPEAVYYMEEDDLYTVDYTTLIPFLIKTAQEQQTRIEDQQNLLEEQQALMEAQQLQIEELQALVVAQNADRSTPDATFNSLRPKDTPAETVTTEANRLWSNVPNPFKQETRIRYALTDDVREARLCIYDLSGKQLSCHRLNDRGESEFTLRAASLMPGIYLYSLIADGNVIDTHRMVVTE